MDRIKITKSHGSYNFGNCNRRVDLLNIKSKNIESHKVSPGHEHLEKKTSVKFNNESHKVSTVHEN